MHERWAAAGFHHWQALQEAGDRVERMRMLASSPMFSLWCEVRKSLEEAADEIESLRAQLRKLEGERPDGK